MKNKTVYVQSADIAREKDELDLYRESRKLNASCAEAIDNAIHDSNYELYRYDLKTAAASVIDEYGAERVAWVLANNLKNRDYDGRFSDEHKQWAKSCDVSPEPRYVCNAHPVVLDGFIRHARQTIAEQEKQQADAFFIYQLKPGDESRDYRWEPYDRLQAVGLPFQPALYEHVYTGRLESDNTLESIFQKFNIDRPEGFTGHSLSVSDIIVLQQAGNVTAHYVDRFGFQELPEFADYLQGRKSENDLLSDEDVESTLEEDEDDLER